MLVTGSLPMIGQVIVNLLKNALSASSAAGRAGAEVTVTLRGGFAEIAVADFGTGVSADAAKTMFAPFSKSARGGMGLGLAICQRIADDARRLALLGKPREPAAPSSGSPFHSQRKAACNDWQGQS